LEVLTPVGSVIDTKVDLVSVPGILGELGIMDGHLPLLSALRAGVLRYETVDGAQAIAIGTGFVEVGAHHRVLVLTDRHHHGKDVVLDQVKAERDEALAQLAQWKENVEELDSDTGRWQERADHRQLQEAADWAQAKLDAALTRAR
jgi:F-type H+-transporting ATPase subunit epsilon